MAWNDNIGMDLDEYLDPKAAMAMSGSKPNVGWGLQPQVQQGQMSGAIAEPPPGALPPLTPGETSIQNQARQVTDQEAPPPVQFAAPSLPITQTGSTTPAQSGGGSALSAATESASGASPNWSQAIGNILGSFGSTLAGGKWTPITEESQKKSPWSSAASRLANVRERVQSDVRAKRDIRPAGGEAKTLLDAIRTEGPMAYHYKEGVGVEGQQFGPMAQTLEKGGPLGQMMVGKDQKGMRYLKQPEMEKGLLAMMAEQQRQIEALQQRTAPTTWRDVLAGIAPQGAAVGRAYRDMQKAAAGMPRGETRETLGAERLVPPGAYSIGEYPATLPGAVQISDAPGGRPRRMVGEEQPAWVVEDDAPGWKVSRR